MGILLLLILLGSLLIYGQQSTADERHRKAIALVIDRYSEAREKRDTLLLKSILTSDVDQLVSTGEWRTGIDAAIEGMMKSSANSPGTRTLHIEKMKMLSSNIALADCRYEIQNADGTTRKMWSSFVIVYQKRSWKITAIRNMMPVP